MPSTPSEPYINEIRRHQPTGEAIVKRSGVGVTVLCICGAVVLSCAPATSLSDMHRAVGAHALREAERAHHDSEETR